MAKKRGIFFVLVSFILIMYMFVYLTAWIRASQIAEKTSSEKFRAASIETSVREITQDNLDRFFGISGRYALFKINQHAGDEASPLRYNSSNRLQYLRHAFFSAMVDGKSSDFDGSTLAYTSSETGQYTFSGWESALNMTLFPAGLDIARMEITPLAFNQTDPVTFNVSIGVRMTVRDRLSSVLLERQFNLTRSFNVTGFDDPMILRESRKLGLNDGDGAHRQMYYAGDDADIGELAPDAKETSTMGAMGYFYGPVIEASDADSIRPGMRPSFIVAGDYREILNITNYQLFGAFILTNAPNYSSSPDSCPQTEENTFMALHYTDVGCHYYVDSLSMITSPFIVAPDFDITDFPSAPDSENNGDYPHALIVAKYAMGEVTCTDCGERKKQAGYLYDIESLRDMAICTHYLKSERGPSYPQRLSSSWKDYAGGEFGMESFVVGTWAGGKDLPLYNEYSRVDFEFFRKIEGTKIRGMPGCKGYMMCSSEVGDSAPLGQFALSSDSIDIYDPAAGINCGNGMAGCDEP
jgi:hypothetical protein